MTPAPTSGPVDKDAKKVLGLLLKDMREKAKMSNGVAAKTAAVNQSTVSKIESGTVLPGEEILVSLLRIYGAPPSAQEWALIIWARAHLPPRAEWLWVDLGFDGTPIGPR